MAKRPVVIAHYRGSEERLKEFTDITANCGAIVPRAFFVTITEEGEVFIPRTVAFKFCKECSHAAKIQTGIEYWVADGTHFGDIFSDQLAGQQEVA